LCESESSVDALEAAGIKSTTWAGGASSPQKEALSAELKGCNILYIADNDKAGLKCLEKLEEFLPTFTNSWTVLLGEPGEDARDLLFRGALDSLFDRAFDRLEPQDAIVGR
jgi:DNA primase